MYTIMEHNL